VFVEVKSTLDVAVRVQGAAGERPTSGRGYGELAGDGE